jgi:hypothetical protein
MLIIFFFVWSISSSSSCTSDSGMSVHLLLLGLEVLGDGALGLELIEALALLEHGLRDFAENHIECYMSRTSHRARGADGDSDASRSKDKTWNYTQSE